MSIGRCTSGACNARKKERHSVFPYDIGSCPPASDYGPTAKVTLPRMFKLSTVMCSNTQRPHHQGTKLKAYKSVENISGPHCSHV